MQGHGGLGPVGSVSANSTEYVQVEVGLDEEVYYEDEDVVCSQLVVPCVGMEFKKVLLPLHRHDREVRKHEFIVQEGLKDRIRSKLWGRYAFEKQAAGFYTGEAFGKFQELLRDSTRFKVRAVAGDDQGWSIQIVHPNSTRVRTVTIDKDATSYTCSCNMFDRDGLLCPHILKVFTSGDVEKIIEKYLLRRWSKELRYNALCRKMTSLAAEACLGPEKCTIASAEIDQSVETVRAVGGSLEMQQDEVHAGEASNVATGQQTQTPTVMVKNPPRTNRKGRPKEKVERLKSIVLKEATKIPPYSYCFEDGHSVQICVYMAKAEAITRELKL
ncbi:hypothetical protein SETIT_2G209300v2 [Setaria italica]|uniref:Protein FAR1-RELATED SEQUENCE n=1 Tax=Setaria italica TaxID=4555 RepID=K4A1U3_SETIT|nr:hypothetical protein SETIT_2G209300v2 [Setaria italica]